MSERYDDNVIHVDSSEELRQQNRERFKNNHKLRVNATLIVVVLLIFIFIGVYIFNRMRSYNSIKVVKSADTVYEANAEYLEFGNNLLRYTPDGVSYIDANGDTVWTSEMISGFL